MRANVAWALRNAVFGGLVSVSECSVAVSFYLSTPSDQMFHLYHTSMEPASNADKENAIG